MPSEKVIGSLARQPSGTWRVALRRESRLGAGALDRVADGVGAAVVAASVGAADAVAETEAEAVALAGVVAAVEGAVPEPCEQAVAGRRAAVRSRGRSARRVLTGSTPGIWSGWIPGR